MPTVPLDSDSLTIVVKGHFKAAIFSPAWLWKQELIGPEEYEAAVVEIISPDVAKFSCLWLNCLITGDTLQFGTNDNDEFERVRDAVVGVLRILDQTPVGALGINRAVGFHVETISEWHAIGDALTPKVPWEEVLKLPGMSNIAMWGVREDLYKGRVVIAVEPAGERGVSIIHNDHYDLTMVESQATSRDDPNLYNAALMGTATQEKLPVALEILRDSFQASISRSTQAVSHIFAIGGKK
ncbi:hypothetical protein E1263_05150 [Kribbella antibiotica]|uniref:TIGR04255 family protein n=1 Tax=Kribbella antibiotica TaxID=190195 RepID=A0A4R4ZT62_9ACTN|nr:hypothetical protein [Kribbella antibiotica]TDD62005.1 hypothetical protein E1263_05150 [Kribbella antibiotica]